MKNNNRLVPRLRFKEFSGEWEEKKLENFLDYLQPTKYLVKSEDYNDKYETPVLTAGKSFILGYTNEKEGVFKENLPVIIFDDFTTATQFVDFPFKAKSSAMKLLTAKENHNIKFYYELMQTINFEVAVHQRHWISLFSKFDVPTTSLPEQQKIADTLSSLDTLIESEQAKLTQLQEHKKGLMQNLFPQEGESMPKVRFKEFENDGEWEEDIINQIAKVTTGNKDTQNKVDNGLYPFFVRSQTVERIDSFSFDGEAILTSGDGVGVGKNFHYIDGKFDFHQRVYCIYDFDKRVLGKYFYLFFAEHFYNRVSKMSAKNSVDSVRMAMITDMSIAFPSKLEQQKIADTLSSLDDLISSQTQRIELLQQHKKGLMQGLFPSAQ